MINWKNDQIEELRNTPPDQVIEDSVDPSILYVGWKDPRSASDGGSGKYIIGRHVNSDNPNAGYRFELAEGNWFRPKFNWSSRETLTYKLVGE